MSVVLSLLRAIDRADGEALVMHVGEKPYVVTSGGHAELAANALTVSAMTGMLDQLLPEDSRKLLNELGAVEYHLPPEYAPPGTRYSVVAARGGNDIWIEVRRHKLASQPVAVPLQQGGAIAVEEPPPPASAAAAVAAPPSYQDITPVAEEMPEPLSTEAPLPVRAPEPDVVDTRAYEIEDRSEPPIDVPSAVNVRELPEPIEEPQDRFELTPLSEEEAYAVNAIAADLDSDSLQFDELPPPLNFTAEADLAAAAADIPMARVNVRVEPGRPGAIGFAALHGDPLLRLLSVAAGHGASAVYVAPLAKPSLRLDGEIRVLDEAPLTQAQLEAGLRLLLGLEQESPIPAGEVETRELQDVGRVQYLGFREHRGLGAMFRMLPGRAISSEQAGLAPAIQSLCTEPEGLLIVAGVRDAGKSTLVAALVDQINRTRRDHVITVESEIPFVHGNRMSFISQREARDEERFSETLLGALREAPDVLVIDGVMNGDVAATALRAAADGHLVIVSVNAATTAAALERFVSVCGDDRDEAQALVGEHLRGVIMQSLLRKTGGGRAAAREVLVNVPTVAALVRGAQFDQIPTVINSGRRVGMVPLNDALLALVQGRALDVRQAYRKSPDPQELLEMLNTAGFDTSFAQKLE